MNCLALSKPYTKSSAGTILMQTSCAFHFYLYHSSQASFAVSFPSHCCVKKSRSLARAL